jgi:hypothetical protein
MAMNRKVSAGCGRDTSWTQASGRLCAVANDPPDQSVWSSTKITEPQDEDPGMFEFGNSKLGKIYFLIRLAKAKRAHRPPSRHSRLRATAKNVYCLGRNIFVRKDVDNFEHDFIISKYRRRGLLQITRGSKKFAALFACSGISEIRTESFCRTGSTTCREWKTYWRDCGSVSGGRDSLSGRVQPPRVS